MNEDVVWRIRPANVVDAAGLHACMEAAYLAYQERLGGRRLPPMDVDYALEIRDNPTWIALSGTDDVIGGIIMTFEGDTATIANVAVHPDYQGNGIGGGLMHHAEQIALERDCSRIHLATHVLLTENVSLYQYLGYRVIDQDDTRVTMRKGLLSQPYEIPVARPDQLPRRLPGAITRLPGRYNFKPHIGRLADGELVMFVAHTHSEEIFTSQGVDTPSRSLSSHVVMYRSTDEGETWGRGRHVPELMGGHEPSVTVIDGVLFVKIQVHGSGGYPDPYAQRDHTYAVVARSDDGGQTFTTTILDRELTGAAEGDTIETARNILQLGDGRLWLGVGVGSRHRVAVSDDRGVSWRMDDAQVTGVSYPSDKSRSFFCESILFVSPRGRLMMLSRVDFDFAQFDQPLPYDTEYVGGTGLDNFDGLVLFTSSDDGQSWAPQRAVGFPALMYPSVVTLDDTRLLLTYTVREIPPEGSGSIHPKVGIQAIVAHEAEDGSVDFDFSGDVIILDDCTPDSMRNAGGFGNTLRMPDGTFVTPFSYPLIDADILGLADRKEYLKEEVFDHWASMQDTYSFRYKDIAREDPQMSELHLRRNFSALFLYAQAGQKGGIAAAVARWSLP